MRQLIIIVTLCFFTPIVTAKSEAGMIERKKAINESLISYYHSYENFKESTFSLIFENVDLQLIEYNGYQGYYHKKIQVDGIINSKESFFVKITESQIQFGYENEVEAPIDECAVGDDERLCVNTSGGIIWIFKIDKENIITLDYIEAIG